MSASITSDEIKNELKTTLTARHDLGPEYDDAFIRLFHGQARGESRP